MSGLLVTPGKGVGPFVLGSSLPTVLEVISKNHELRSNEVVHCEEDPLSMDICVTANDLGIRFLFDPLSQRLRLIDIFDLSRIVLLYANTKFSGPVTPSLRLIYRTFGPTYPGTLDAKRSLWALQYPGICFMFRVPADLPISSSAGQQQQQELPLELPDGTSPVAARVFVHCGSRATAHPLPLPALRDSQLEFGPVVAQPGAGLFFSRRQRFVGFDSYAQDVLADLGAPSSVFVKSHDKMRIHTGGLSSSRSRSGSDAGAPLSSAAGLDSGDGDGGLHGLLLETSGAPGPDVIWNYFHLGLDFVLSGATHRVIKIILHTNLPGRPDFARYRKCNFLLVGPERSAGPVDPAPPALPASTPSSATASPSSSSVTSTALPPLGSESKRVIPAAISTAAAGTEGSDAVSTPVFHDDDSPPADPSQAGQSKKQQRRGRGRSGSSSSRARGASVEESAVPSSSRPIPIPLHPGQQQQQPAMSIPRSGSASSRLTPSLSAHSPALGYTQTPPAVPSPLLTSHSTSSSPASSAGSPSAMGRAAAAAALPSLSLDTLSTGSSASAPGRQQAKPVSLPPVVTADTKWQEVLRILGPCPTRPMVHSMPREENPFSPTLFFAYPGVLFEVVSNGYLASVTLFPDI